MGLIAGIAELLGDRTVNPRQFNTIIEAANNILKQMAIPHIPAPPGCGLDAWLASDECGASSKWLHQMLNGSSRGGHESYPHDISDFERCVIMLKAVPGNAVRMAALLEDRVRIAETGSPWNRLLGAWGELVALLDNTDEESRIKLNERIHELTME